MIWTCPQIPNLKKKIINYSLTFYSTIQSIYHLDPQYPEYIVCRYYFKQVIRYMFLKMIWKYFY